jgi:uncharacterized Zn finger protein (UPF0148 family)
MIKCPVCGEYTFTGENDFDVCPVCEWENDGVQTDDPSYWGGANELCLNDYKKEWENSKRVKRFAALSA